MPVVPDITIPSPCDSERDPAGCLVDTPPPREARGLDKGLDQGQRDTGLRPDFDS